MSKDQALWDKAKKLIPGGTQLYSKRPELYLPMLWPKYCRMAKGCHILDLDNKVWKDFSHMGVGSCILGYADPVVNKHIERIIDYGTQTSLNFPEEVELAEKLVSIHPWAEKVRYTRSGGEAVEVALRIARSHSGKDTVGFCGYHGWKDWYLAANLSDNKNLDGHLLKGLKTSGVPRNLKGTSIPFEYDNIESLKYILDSYDIGVIIMEPLRYKYPDDKYLLEVVRITRERDAILIFDEITSGFRQFPGSIHMKFGIHPDIVVVAKAMGNGYPIGAVIGTDEIMEAAQDSFISSTSWTERIGPTAALSTIQRMDDINFEKDVAGKRVDMFVKGIKDVAVENGIDLEILNALKTLIGLNFKCPNPLGLRTLYTQEMWKRGYLASGGMYLTAGHKMKDIERFIETLQDVFPILKDAIDTDTINNKLEVPVAETGFKRLV